jgi:CRP-like cAMP-binding protein
MPWPATSPHWGAVGVRMRGTCGWQGDEDGQEMYILETGIAIASIEKIGPVKIYRRGDAFGELALITDAPRQATISVQGAATFLMLRREDFAHKAVVSGPALSPQTPQTSPQTACSV